MKKTAQQVIDEIFGKRIYTPGDVVRLKRKAWGMTQKQLSEMIKISEVEIEGYEKGRLEIGWEVACKLAAAVGVHPTSIMQPNGFDDCEDIKEIARKAQAFREVKFKSLKMVEREAS